MMNVIIIHNSIDAIVSHASHAIVVVLYDICEQGYYIDAVFGKGQIVILNHVIVREI